jgi:diacylglycerol kinase
LNERGTKIQVKFILARNFLLLQLEKKMKKFIRSFGFAFLGIFKLLRTERNFKIQFAAFIVALVVGFYFSITDFEWLLILLISALVLSLEALNSAIEKLCDLYSIENDKRIKLIKDVAAGAVLIAAIFAIVIAVVIFRKYF